MSKESVIIFGRGKYYLFKKEELHRKYIVQGFLDNAVAKGDVEYEENMPVYHPEDFAKHEKSCPIILMTLEWFPLYKQLIDFGVEEERVKFGLLEKPCYDSLERFLENEEIGLSVRNKKLILSRNGNKTAIADMELFKETLRKVYYESDPFIRTVGELGMEPSSRSYGSERGKSIDRIYIESFLEKNRQYINGVCMEMGDDTYIRKYGSHVVDTIVLHVYGKGRNAKKGNFETGEGLKKNSVDCLICTQTLQAIYDVKSSIRNIYDMLTQNGTALITVSGVGGTPVSLSDYHNWGVYWRFSDLSLRRLLEEKFDSDKIEIQSFGNMKTQIAFAYGMCAEELRKEDFWFYDEKYPMIITAVARK